jgi:hypothetical protein
VSVLLALDAGGNAGPIGLLVVVLMALATVLLIRNMDKRVKRLPRDFPPPRETPPTPGPEKH